MGGALVPILRAGGPRVVIENTQLIINSWGARFFAYALALGIVQIGPMPLIRMPSRALIEALGWGAIEELDNYLEDAAEQIRAERRRLEATRHEVMFPPGREADMLWRIGNLEYHLREEISRTGQRLRREIQDLKDEVRRLRGALPPSQAPTA